MGRWFEWQIWHLCVWLAEFGRNRSSRITMIPMIYPQSNMAGWEVYYKWQLSGEHHLCIGLSCLSCLIARGQINPLRCPPDFGVHFMNWNSVNRKSCWSVLSNGMIGIIMNRLGYGLGKKSGVRSWAYHQPKNSSVCLKIPILIATWWYTSVLVPYFQRLDWFPGV